MYGNSILCTRSQHSLHSVRGCLSKESLIGYMLYMYYWRVFVAIMKAKTGVFVLHKGKLLRLSLWINLPQVLILWKYTLICVKIGVCLYLMSSVRGCFSKESLIEYMLYNMYYWRFFVAIMKAKTVVFVLDNGKLLLLSLLINLPHVFILWEYTLICVKTGVCLHLMSRVCLNSQQSSDASEYVW